MNFTGILEKILGDFNEQELKKIMPIVKQINEIYESWHELSDEDIKGKTKEFKERLNNGETVDDIMPEAYATVKQACKRMKGQKVVVKGTEVEWDMIPFDVQLVGGIVLNQGRVAEMKTGEGKTLVATLPLYLNALSGKGSHLVTVNEYLTARDAEWMSYLYNWLGMEVGVVIKDTPLETRKEEYAKDITYVENSELGFDYLRDNLAKSQDERVLLARELNYAIVDEADSIMIDEARTPLIISHPSEEPTDKYYYYSKLVKTLTPCKQKKKQPKNFLKQMLAEVSETNEEQEKEECDYYIDEKLKAVTLTSQGISKLENAMGVENLYKDLGFQEIHHIENSLKAGAVFEKDKDYLVTNGEVVLVDENTGRAMHGRRFSEGLHQAIEAKEGVQIQRESKTLASITYQNFFNLYTKLAGMTGTAATEGEEFENIYGLEVLRIPTHKDVIRVDKRDKVYFNHTAKWTNVLDSIKFYHEIGQPFLIGTSSIYTSEELSSMLNKHNIAHYVLNAKNHEKEAQIVESAGNMGSVVVATNMAGRGTDVKLEDGLNEKLAENYATWIGKQIKGSEYKKEAPKGVSAVVYSEDEFDLTISGLQKVFGITEDDVRNAEKGWHHCNDENIKLKIKFYNKKQSKDDPFCEILIYPGEVSSPDLIQKDFHYGLFILGTEKHESRRIDNQLRGRAGRQGDPGVSQFFVALDDEIMRKMGGERIQGIAKAFLPADEVDKMELTQKQFSSSIERSQSQMEGWHFSTRKQLYDYDSVVDKQRQRIYSKRDEILKSEEDTQNGMDVKSEVRSFIVDVVDNLVNTYTNIHPWNLEELAESLNQVSGPNFSSSDLKKFGKEENLKSYIENYLLEEFDKISSVLPEESFKEFLKREYLEVIDKYWVDHIDEMQYLREKVSLYSFAQLEPLVIYKKEAYEKFQKLMFNIKQQVLSDLFRTDLSFLKDQNNGNVGYSVNSQGNQEGDMMTMLQNASKKVNNIQGESSNDTEVIETDNSSVSSPENKKTRPNDPCPCGSGKKYKKCCGEK